jgi:antitoxin HigA-1
MDAHTMWKLPTIIKTGSFMTDEEKAIREATPGRYLKVEFLDEYGLTQTELARRTGIPASTINEIIKGKRRINADVAIALGAFFGNNPSFWANLDSAYELAVARFGKAEKIRKKVNPLRTEPLGV